jgi:hypothetical protein
MEKLVLKGKKEIRQLLEDSIKKAVHALGVTKSKRKTERTISKSAKRIADVVAQQMKKTVKDIKKEMKGSKVKKDKAPKTAKTKKVKKIEEPELEIA